MRALYAIWMGLMGLAGGYVVNVLILAEQGAWSESVGLALAIGAGLIGLIGGAWYSREIL